MLNKNKLNKIKVILSARNGTLVSKFTPGGSIELRWYKAGTGYRYSTRPNENSNWEKWKTSDDDFWSNNSKYYSHEASALEVGEDTENMGTPVISTQNSQQSSKTYIEPTQENIEKAQNKALEKGMGPINVGWNNVGDLLDPSEEQQLLNKLNADIQASKGLNPNINPNEGVQQPNPADTSPEKKVDVTNPNTKVTVSQPTDFQLVDTPATASQTANPDTKSKLGKIGLKVGDWFGNAVDDLFGKDKNNPGVVTKIGNAVQDFANSDLGQNMGQIAGGIGKAADLADQFLVNKANFASDDPSQGKGRQAYDAVANSLMGFAPIGCVCAGSRVITGKGEFKNIENLKLEDGIVGWGNKQTKPLSIYWFKPPEYKECLRIETKAGVSLECSIDHPILSDFSGRAKSVTINGTRKRIRLWEFRRADSLNIGDFIGIGNSVDIWGTQEMWNPYLVGLLIGDGTYGLDHGVRQHSADPDTWKYIEDNNLGYIIKKFEPGNKYSKEFRTYRIYDGPTHLKLLGIYGQTCANKSLPEDIYKYTKNSICKLIAGLFDTDGYVSENLKNKEGKIVFCKSNLKLIKLVKELLFKLGIHSVIQTIKEKETILKDRLVKSKESYKLVIKDKQSIVNFYNLIPLNISYKKETLIKLHNYCNKGKFKDNRELSGAKADKIVKITPIGPQLVYNLLADDDHTYLANMIITHNTIAGGAMKVGALINDIAGKKADSFAADLDTLSTVGGSYGGSSSEITEAASKAGKTYGLLGNSARKKTNRLIAKARRELNIMSNISKDVQDMQSASTFMSDVNNFNYQYSMNGGYDLRYMRAAKGAKLEYFDFEANLSEPEFIPSLSDNTEEFSVKLYNLPKVFKQGGTLLDLLDEDYSFTVTLSDIPEIALFKKGGQIEEREIEVIETDTNLKSVIPEGALHKNKHHLDQVGIDDSELTKKGIPVVDNDGNQQAEIELNEIIFTLEVTQELEKRYKEYYEKETSLSRKDELALEAGKLLWKEILYNTDDRTGLISTLKKGGNIESSSSKEESKEKPKERIDELIEYAKLLNPRFILRMSEPLKYIVLPSGEYATHMMAAEYDDRDNQWYVFPLVFENENGDLIYEQNPWKALDINKAKGNVLKFDNREDALMFSESPDINTGYKRGWPEFFKLTPEYKKGGIINQDYINLLVKLALINILTK